MSEFTPSFEETPPEPLPEEGEGEESGFEPPEDAEPLPLTADETTTVRSAVARASSLLPAEEEEIPPDPRPYEQEIRDLHGYAPSEDRTRSERDAVAERMLAKHRSRFEGVKLPADIEAVWGGGRLDSSGQPAADTARHLISEWGEERFRGSQIHKGALEEIRRREARAAYLEAQAKAKAKENGTKKR